MKRRVKNLATNHDEISKVQSWLDERRLIRPLTSLDAKINTQAEAWLANQRVKLNPAGRPAVC